MMSKTKFKESFSDFKTRLKSDKKLLLIVVIGILGMILLLVTEFVGDDTEPEKISKASTKDSKYTYEQQYKYQIQLELQKLISSIEGAGNTKVLVTLDSGSKSVYAIDEKIDDDDDTSQGEKDYKKDSKYSRETEHIIINSSNKNDEGLVVEVLQPQIRGVAVVCQGADSAMVRKDITDTVTAVLDIDSNKVCITKMIND